VALWQSLVFTGMAASAVALLSKLELDEDSRARMPSFFSALLIPFSGLALSVLSYPHTEALAFSALCLSFALCLKPGKGFRLLGCLLFIFALGVREDVGFHAFGHLMTFLVLSWLTKKTSPNWKPMLLAALIGFIYSAGVLVFQRNYFTGDNAFARIYSGDPAWAHLRADFVLMRIRNFLLLKPYISLPFLILIIYSIRRRNILMTVPILANIPWIAVNITAIAPSAGGMMAYYAYPLLSVFIWPIVLLRLLNEELNSAQKRELILLNLAIVLVSIITYRTSDGRKMFRAMNPVHLKLQWDGTYEMHKCTVDRFMNTELNRKMMGPEFGALFPSSFSRRDVLFETHETSEADFILLWNDGYYIKALVKDSSVQQSFEPASFNNKFYSIWKRKSAPSDVIDWARILSPCQSFKERNEVR
jgi:hypothetical protein